MLINKPGTSLEKIHERRRFSWEFVIVAVFIALLINIFSSCLLNFLDPNCANPNFWQKGIIISGISLLAIVGTIVIVKWRNEREIIGLTLLLPIYVDKQKEISEILHHNHYAPARYGRQFFMKRGRDFAIQFAKAWPGPNPIKNANFTPGHFCWDTIAQLMQAIVFTFLRKFGEMTLTESARFHGEFRRISGFIPFWKMTRDKWPTFLASNIFLKETGVESILLPKHAKLLYPKHHYVNKNVPVGLTISSRYGSMTFYVSTYWTVIKETKEAINSFSPSDASKASFLAIPLEIHLTLKGFYLSRQGMSYQYIWFQQLINNMRRRMSWGRFLKDASSPADDG